MEVFGVLGGVFLLAAISLALTIKKVLIICQPSEVVIVSGPRRRSDQKVGYRHIRGGRTLRIPILELVDHMDLTTMAVDVAVRNGYSRDGIPLTVQGVANLKIDGDPPGLDNAVEKLMGKPREQIIRIARETLEGNLRGVLARLTPEQVNEDKESFATELIEEAEIDLQRLGLLLDTLNIQTVSDEVGYLDSIGRTQNADLQKRARIAEADRNAEAAVREANNMLQTRVAQLEADIEVLKAQAAKRIIDARTLRTAEVAREKSGVDPEIARATEELKVQQARIEEVRLELEADVVAPARSYKAQREAAARAEVAPIIEGGRATAEGLTSLAETWTEAGDRAKEIFLLEKLDVLVGILVGTVSNVRVDRLTVVGDDSTAGKAASLVEQLSGATGIDVKDAVEGITSRAKRSLSRPE